jgi:hypothetical protein
MGWRGLTGLAVAALAIRLVYALLALRGYVPLTDAHHYHGLATAVGEGRGLVHPFPTWEENPTAFRPPLWPLLLGGVYAVTGASLGVAQVVTAVLGSLAVVGLAVLAGRLAGRVAAIATGVTAALHPALVAGDAPPLSEPLGAVLLIGIVLALLSDRTLAAGLLTGGLLLTRPSAQAVVLALAAFLLVSVGWRRTVAFVAVVGLVASPWLVRNTVQMGSPVLTTSGGFNLAAIYSPLALQEGGFVDPVYDFRLAALRGRPDVPPGSPPGALEVALDAEFRAEGLAGLRTDPLAVLRVGRDNLGRLLALPGEPDARDADLLDGRPPGVQSTVRWAGLGILLVGSAGLVVLVRRRPRDGLLLVVATASAPAASLLLVAAPRLRQPLDLAACVGVGVVVAAVVARRRRSDGAGRQGVPSAGAPSAGAARAPVDTAA